LLLGWLSCHGIRDLAGSCKPPCVSPHRSHRRLRHLRLRYLHCERPVGRSQESSQLFLDPVGSPNHRLYLTHDRTGIAMLKHRLHNPLPPGTGQCLPTINTNAFLQPSLAESGPSIHQWRASGQIANTGSPGASPNRKLSWNLPWVLAEKLPARNS